MAELADGLKNNSGLTALNLNDNEIGADGATVLAEALKSNGALTKLNLNNNKIGDSFAKAFAMAAESGEVKVAVSKRELCFGAIFGTLAVICAVLFVSFVLTNFLVTWLQRRRHHFRRWRCARTANRSDRGVTR